MLHPLADDVWAIDATLERPGMCLPVRATILRLANRALLVYAPFELDESLAAQIDEVGRVTWLVAPNAYHHLRLRRWKERWPQAELWGTAAVRDKRSDLSFDGVLGESAPPAAWDDQIEHVVLAGAPKLGEVVLFHRPTGTLLAADLVFNVGKPKGVVLGLFMRLTGVHGRFGLSRMWKMLTKDRPRMHEDVERVLAWDIRRVIMAHGDVVEQEAHGKLASALSSMRAAG